MTMLQDYRLGIVLLALVITVIAAPYCLGTSSPRGRHRGWVVAVLVLLFWLLAGVQLLRASP